MSENVLDYTTKSFEDCLELAEAVHSLGGTCSPASAAGEMDKKLGGSFTDRMSSSVKFGLIIRDSGELILTELFKQIKNLLSDEEKVSLLQKSFLSIELYKALYEKFKKLTLPGNLKNVLFRDFKIPEKQASRVSKYFISGARYVGLLSENNSFLIVDISSKDIIEPEERETEFKEAIPIQKESPIKYTIRISGPSGNLVGPLEIEDLDQLNFAKNSINAALELIEKKLKEKSTNETS